MTGKKSDALTTVEDAAEVLHLDEDELDAAISDGTLRRVTHAGETFVLGADVDKALRDQDPEYLAKLVGREGCGAAADPDNFAADIPRL